MPDRESIYDHLVNRLPTDTEMLDWLQSQTTGYGLGWAFFTNNVHGSRSFRESQREGLPDVREAIMRAMVIDQGISQRQVPPQRQADVVESEVQSLESLLEEERISERREAMNRSLNVGRRITPENDYLGMVEVPIQPQNHFILDQQMEDGRTLRPISIFHDAVTISEQFRRHNENLRAALEARIPSVTPVSASFLAQPLHLVIAYETSRFTVILRTITGTEFAAEHVPVLNGDSLPMLSALLPPDYNIWYEVSHGGDRTYCMKMSDDSYLFAGSDTNTLKSITAPSLEIAWRRMIEETDLNGWS
jgi:hypothetical protein